MENNKKSFYLITVFAIALITFVASILILGRIGVKLPGTLVVNSQFDSQYVSAYYKSTVKDKDNKAYYKDTIKNLESLEISEDLSNLSDTGYGITFWSASGHKNLRLVQIGKWQDDGKVSAESLQEGILLTQNGKKTLYLIDYSTYRELMDRIDRDMEGSDSIESVHWNEERIERDSYNGYSKNQIVSVTTSANFAWEFYYYGSFIDLSGNIYSFELTEDDLEHLNSEEMQEYDNGMLGYDFLSNLYATLVNDYYLASDPVGHVDPMSIREVWLEGQTIKSPVEFEEEDVARDAVQSSLFLTIGQTLVGIQSKGDINHIAKDKYTREVAEKLEKIKVINGR